MLDPVRLVSVVGLVLGQRLQVLWIVAAAQLPCPEVVPLNASLDCLGVVTGALGLRDQRVAVRVDQQEQDCCEFLAQRRIFPRPSH